MAHLFVYDGSDWLVAPLEDDAHSLWGDRETSLRPGRLANGFLPDGGDDSPPVLLRDRGSFGDGSWAVIQTPGSSVRVNGISLTTGIRVLSHRDELRVSGIAGRAFFSFEDLAAVAPFDGAEGSHCPRCQQAILGGTVAVRCPQCGVWHHQSEEFGCWTYSPTCALCDQPTDLEGEFRWTPEEADCRG